MRTLGRMAGWLGVLGATVLGGTVACRTLPQPTDFGVAADVTTAVADSWVSDAPDVQAPLECPAIGWQRWVIDVDGQKREVCAADSPV